MFEFSETACYNMPAHFGGDEGAPGPTVYHDVTDLKIVYETDPALLSRYVPACFEIVRPVLIVNYQMCRQVDWMSGGGYNLVSIVVPAAFSKNGARIEGGYVLVTWENNATPIIRGRETLGYPKIFAQIEDPHRMGNRIFTRATHEGATFLTIDFDIEKTMDAEAVAALNASAHRVNVFGWRYIPNIGRPGAALSHPTLAPQGVETRAGWTVKGQVRWEKADGARNPVQGRIINALADLPVSSYVACWMTQVSLTFRNDLARDLSGA